MMVGAARRALDDHDKCGDAFAWWTDDALWTICLVDGLGHGPEAALAAEAALAEVENWRGSPPATVMAEVDAAIRWSRGAALAFVQVDAVRRTLTYAGVGNVRGCLFGDPTLRFEGAPGIVGAGCRNPQAQTVPWREGDLLLLWTDGMGSSLNIDQPSRRLRGDPQALAERLIDKFSTRRDDVGIVCCLLQGAPP